MTKQQELDKLEQVIRAINKRNKRVEADKAWETSIIRKIVISLLTYLVVVLFMYISDISRPWVNAVVPSVGFILSTLTLPFIKKWWIKKYG